MKGPIFAFGLSDMHCCIIVIVIEFRGYKHFFTPLCPAVVGLVILARTGGWR